MARSAGESNSQLCASLAGVLPQWALFEVTWEPVAVAKLAKLRWIPFPGRTHGDAVSLRSLPSSSRARPNRYKGRAAPVSIGRHAGENSYDPRGHMHQAEIITTHSGCQWKSKLGHKWAY
jgi:hypothetical protein